MTDKVFNAIWKIAAYQDPSVARSDKSAENDKGFNTPPKWVPTNTHQNTPPVMPKTPLQQFIEKYKNPKSFPKTANDSSNSVAKEHIVSAGENPSTIARARGVSLAELMRANGLDEQTAKRLRIGQKLVIPAGTAAANPPVKPPAAKQLPRKLPTAQQILDLRRRMKNASMEQIPGLVDEAGELTRSNTEEKVTY